MELIVLRSGGAEVYISDYIQEETDNRTQAHYLSLPEAFRYQLV